MIDLDLGNSVVVGLTLRIRIRLIAVASVCFGFSFLCGIFQEDFPQFSSKKYMMPGSYSVHLNRAKYEIWYYPGWHCRGQSRETAIPKMAELQEPLSSYEFPYPKIAICDSLGTVRQYVSDTPSSGDNGFGDRVQCIYIGELDIEKAGVYSLSAAGKKSGNFVLALVPPAAKNYPLFGHFGFYDYDKMKLEPSK